MRKLILVAGVYWLTFAVLGANQNMPAFGLYGMAVHVGAILFAALVIAIDAANDEIVKRHQEELDAERHKADEAESRLRICEILNARRVAQMREDFDQIKELADSHLPPDADDEEEEDDDQ